MKPVFILPLFLLLSALASCTNNTDTLSFSSNAASPIASSRDTVIGSNSSSIWVQGGTQTSIATSTSSSQAPSPSDVSTQSTLNTQTKTLTYRVPHGSTSTKYTLATDSNGNILTATSSVISGDHESREWNDWFSEEFAHTVVGKKLSDLSSVDAIGGAPLTTEAFMEFIQS